MDDKEIELIHDNKNLENEIDNGQDNNDCEHKVVEEGICMECGEVIEEEPEVDDMTGCGSIDEQGNR